MHRIGGMLRRNDDRDNEIENRLGQLEDNLLNMNNKIFNALCNSLDTAHELFQTTKDLSKLQSEAEQTAGMLNYSLDILHALFDHFGCKEENNDKTKSDTEQLQQLLSFVKENCFTSQEILSVLGTEFEHAPKDAKLNTLKGFVDLGKEALKNGRGPGAAEARAEAGEDESISYQC